MTEMTVNEAGRRSRRFRHRCRGSQVSIYLGKFLRMFVYQNEWKVLPMAAVIAGLVAMVIRSMLFQSMEGTMMGTLALTCVGIWNGCFNSIQVICRERDVIKREHRSGLHITAYVLSHMVFQLLPEKGRGGQVLHLVLVPDLLQPGEQGEGVGVAHPGADGVAVDDGAVRLPGDASGGNSLLYGGKADAFAPGKSPREVQG